MNAAQALAARSETAAQRYDGALHRCRKRRLPSGYPSPKPTANWSVENVALLERYRQWLVSGGLSGAVICQLYVPTAGHVLGLSLKPVAELDLEADLNRVLDYVRAKGLSAAWIKNTRIALVKFRQFLQQQRGQWVVSFRPVGKDYYCQGLPAWLVAQLERYHHLLQSRWRPARIKQQSLNFWSRHTPFWHWVCARAVITQPADVQRQQLLDYVDEQLQADYAVSTINNEVWTLHAFLLHLQDQGFVIPRALLRPPRLKEPERLPRFLTDEQVRLLRDDFEERVAQARFETETRDAVLDRATFYLLWQGGLRVGEVEELLLEDLDLPGKRLMIRQGKGQQDRAAYLTETAAAAIQAYLPVRGEGAADHLFLYRHLPLKKDIIRDRIKAAGRRVRVKVTPHQLRHTCATQLLNAGCRVTSIQKLLGHRKLDSTLVYARVHDHTLAADFYAAMARIEQALKLKDEQTVKDDREPLLALAEQLAVPQLCDERRLELAAQLRTALTWKGAEAMAAMR